MPLSPVEELSDAEQKSLPGPKAAPKPTPKASPKAKDKSKKSKDPKAKPVPKAKKEPNMIGKRPASASAALKKPAAAEKKESTDPPAAIKIAKGLYKNGKYGFKVNGREVFHASSLFLRKPKVLHASFLKVVLHLFLIYLANNP